jgi:hypothetical protein
MAAMRAAMDKPPVLGSTLRPNATGRVMIPTLAGTVADEPYLDLAAVSAPADVRPAGRDSSVTAAAR